MTTYQETIQLTIVVQKYDSEDREQSFISIKLENATIVFSAWIDDDKINESLNIIVNSCKRDIGFIINRLKREALDEL